MSSVFSRSSARYSALPADARTAILGLIVSLLLGSAFTATFILMPAQSAHASPSIPRVACTGFCTGGVQWGNPIWGAAAEIQTQPLTGHVGSTIYDQLDLTDVGHSCGPYASSFAAGYRTRPDNAQTWYFWSQCRPGVDSAPIVNYVYQVPSNNYGFYFYYRMYRYDSTKYEIDFFYNGTYYWSGVSQPNTMLANFIEVDEETTDAQNNISPTLRYMRHNEWEDNLNGGWHFQNSNGHGWGDHPPSFGWDQQPSDYPNTGGLGNICWC